MSSNFTVKRLCEQCGDVFEAKTTVTRFCSKACNSKNNKLKLRHAKMVPMNLVVQRVLNKAIPTDLSSVEFLSVKAAAKLLGASEKILHVMIKSGRLNAVNLSKRKTIVYRRDIDKLFELPQQVVVEKAQLSVADCYHMGEAQQLFNVSEKALFEIIRRNCIDKFQRGKFTYVAKADLNKILNPSF